MVPNMQLVKEVCNEEGFFFRLVNGHANFAEVKFSGKKYFFAYAATPFNKEDVQRVSSDKFLTYSLLSPKIKMPLTKQYLRPDLDPELHGNIQFKSIIEIIDDTKKNFPPTFMMKMNNGSQGKNVFKCKDENDIKKAVDKIFQDDWALLAQELVYKEKEFRVVIVNNKIELIYAKGGLEFFGKQDEIFKKIKKFLAPLGEIINLGWAGLDVIEDKKGGLWLIEINTKPSFEAAVKSGKGELIKPLYKKAFGEILR